MGNDVGIYRVWLYMCALLDSGNKSRIERPLCWRRGLPHCLQAASDSPASDPRVHHGPVWGGSRRPHGPLVRCEMLSRLSSDALHCCCYLPFNIIFFQLSTLLPWCWRESRLFVFVKAYLPIVLFEPIGVHKGRNWCTKCTSLHDLTLQIYWCLCWPISIDLSSQLLQVSERTDSHLDNTHLSLTLWEGVLQLGLEVENWTVNKLDAFAQSSYFQKEEDIEVLQVKLSSRLLFC